MSTQYIAILAGGQSSRMGSDKRFVRFREKTLLEHALSLARSLVSESHILLCGNVPGYASFHDTDTKQGPLAGIRTAMRVTPPYSHISVIPVDMPLLTARLIDSLWEQEAACAYENHELPMCFVNDETAANAMKTIQRQSIRAFLEEINAQRIKAFLRDETSFSNVNSVNELMHAIAREC